MSKAVKILIAVGVAVICLCGSVVTVAGYYAFSFKKAARTYNDGIAAMDGHDYEAALVKFSAALRGWLPKQYRAYAFCNIALCEERSGQCEKAIQDYTEALQIEPTYAFAYECRGGLLWELGETEKAFGDFSEAIRLDPNSHGAFFGRGLIDLDRKDVDQAIEDFSEAARTDPSSPTAYTNRGLAYAYKRDFEHALANFDAAIGLCADDATALANRGWVYLQKEEFAKAISDLTAAIRVEPNHQPIYRSRGSAYFRSGDYAKAITDFQKALQMEPNDGSTLNHLAWLRATCPDAAFRNGKEAVIEATKACEISRWKDGYYIDTLAAAYAETGDFNSAISFEERAIECDDVTQERIADMKARKTLFQSHKPYREGRAQYARRQGMPRYPETGTARL